MKTEISRFGAAILVVSAGPDFAAIDTFLTAQAHGDDQVAGTTIVAGPNGVAETMATQGFVENYPSGVGLTLSSAWRNPERDEAVEGVLKSRHRFGNADDLVPMVPAGVTRPQCLCVLEQAADDLGTGIAEHLGSQRACTDGDVTHVNVQE